MNARVRGEAVTHRLSQPAMVTAVPDLRERILSAVKRVEVNANDYGPGEHHIATLRLVVKGEFDPNMEALASSKTSVRYADGVYHVRNKFMKIIVVVEEVV
jgi:hypothetical protein